MFTSWTSASDNTPPSAVRVDIPARTLAKVGVAALLALGAARLVMALHEVILMGFVAVLVSVVLSSFVDWLQTWGVRRGVGALLALLGILLVVGTVLFVTLPPLLRELHDLFQNLPLIADRLRARLSGNPEIYEAIVR